MEYASKLMIEFVIFLLFVIWIPPHLESAFSPGVEHKNETTTSDGGFDSRICWFIHSQEFCFSDFSPMSVGRLPSRLIYILSSRKRTTLRRYHINFYCSLVFRTYPWEFELTFASVVRDVWALIWMTIENDRSRMQWCSREKDHRYLAEEMQTMW